MAWKKCYGCYCISYHYEGRPGHQGAAPATSRLCGGGSIARIIQRVNIYICAKFGICFQKCMIEVLSYQTIHATYITGVEEENNEIVSLGHGNYFSSDYEDIPNLPSESELVSTSVHKPSPCLSYTPLPMQEEYDDNEAEHFKC